GGGADDVRLFYTGKLAMVTAGHAWVPGLRAAVAQGRLRVGFVAIPHRIGSAPATAIYASAYAVPATVSRRRLAVQLAAYLADTLAQALRGEAGVEVPALTPVAEALAARDTLGWEAAFLRAAQRGDHRRVSRTRDTAGPGRRRLQPAAALHPDALAQRAPRVDAPRRGLSRHRPAARGRGTAADARRTGSVARPGGSELAPGCGP